MLGMWRIGQVTSVKLFFGPPIRRFERWFMIGVIGRKRSWQVAACSKMGRLSHCRLYEYELVLVLVYVYIRLVSSNRKNVRSCNHSLLVDMPSPTCIWNSMAFSHSYSSLQLRLYIRLPKREKKRLSRGRMRIRDCFLDRGPEYTRTVFQV